MDTGAVIARFELERQTLAMMNHADIARVFDAGTTTAGRLYFVMEYVDGVPLTTFCDEHRLDLNARLTLFVRVCLALQHAHQKGVIHRDIKPSNILVTMEGEVPTPKIIDFGIAKATRGQLGEKSWVTRVDQLMGTPPYMSPEQVDSREWDVDTRSDVYALGVLLYEMLTGALPFGSEIFRRSGMEEIRRIICDQTPSRPSRRLATLAADDAQTVAQKRRTGSLQLRSVLVGDLDWIVMRCLEKDRDRRYASAQELADDVRRYLRREPVLAHPPAVAYLVKRFVARHRFACASVVMAALILVGATVVSVRQTLRARDAERIARREAATATAVNQFLVEDLLRQADSNVQADAREMPNPDLKVREALDRAAVQVGNRFKALPMAEAGVRSAIGQSYIGVGQAGAAEPQLRRAWELRQAEFGDDHPDTLAVGLLLARAFVDQGKLEEAATLQSRILETQTERFGPDYPRRYETMNELADSYHLLGRFEECAALQQDVYAHGLRVLGPEHPDTLLAMSNLGNAYMLLNRDDEALDLQTRALAARKRVLGEYHPATLNTLSNLAETYGKLERLEEAEVLQLELLANTRQALGDEHFQTIAALINLAGTYNERENYVASEPLLEEAAGTGRRVLGDEHPITLAALNNLAMVYGRNGRPEDALKTKEQLQAVVAKVFGTDHPNTLITALNLANSYYDLKRYAEAIAVLNPLPEALIARFGVSHAYRRRALERLADSHAALGDIATAVGWRRQQLAAAREAENLPSGHVMGVATVLATELLAENEFAEAEPILREVVAFRDREEPDAWTTFNSHSLLGEALLGQQRYDEAEPRLLEGFRGLRDRGTTIPADLQFRLDEARDRVVRLYEGLGRTAEADRWRSLPSQPGDVAEPTADDSAQG